MPATVRMSYASGKGITPTLALADPSGQGLTFSRSEEQLPDEGDAPVPFEHPLTPQTHFTHFSWPMVVALEVTAAANPSTVISNRTIRLAEPLPTGCRLYFAGLPQYRQSARHNAPKDSGVTGAAPEPRGGGTVSAPRAYTLMSLSPQQWDTTPATSVEGVNGKYLELVCGVDDTYEGDMGQILLTDLGLVAEYNEG